jgi:hypothetical protein
VTTPPNGERVTNARLYDELGKLREHIDDEFEKRPTHKIVALMIAVGVVGASVLNAAPPGVNTRAEAWFHLLVGTF